MTKFPYPYPCEYFPRFDTQNEAASVVEQYKAQRHIKKCAHLYTEAVGGGYSGARKYGPGCRRDSFQLESDSKSRYGGRLFYGCPPDCLLYRPWWKRREGWLKDKWWSLRTGIVGIAKWYASLSPATQVIIALAFLALLSTPWRNTILEGLKIIFAK